MRKILVVIDMQKDFIEGALGTKEAEAIVPAVIEKLRSREPADIFATRDTHPDHYLETLEGQNLPIPHCLKGTAGWQIPREVQQWIPADHIFDKPTFGSVSLAEALRDLSRQEEIELELTGLCTDICVVSNALLLKAYMPEVTISVDPSCCAGVTPEKHRAALETMASCQIVIE